MTLALSVKAAALEASVSASQWERHAPKTEKSRREVILPPVAVEALTAQKQRQYEEKVDGAQAGSTGRHRSGADAGTREEPGLHHQRAAEGGYPSGHGPVRAGRHAAGRAEAPVASGGGDGRGPSAPYPLAARRNSLVFTTQRGLPLHGTNLPKELHKATDRLALPRVGMGRKTKYFNSKEAAEGYLAAVLDRVA